MGKKETAKPLTDTRTTGRDLWHLMLLARQLDEGGCRRLFDRAPHLRRLLKRIGNLAGQLADGLDQPKREYAPNLPFDRAAVVQLLDHLLHLDRLCRSTISPQRRGSLGLYAVGPRPCPN